LNGTDAVSMSEVFMQLWQVWDVCHFH